ncbi:MAG: glycosyltransferase, partial [Pseudomonadota bacterium]
DHVAGIEDRAAVAGDDVAVDQADVLDAYRRSDVFALPCRIAPDGDRDGLPNVLVEAQSQRIACISTPISAVPELIVHGETGLLVEPDDPDALAGALSSLIRDPARRAALAIAGEDRVRAHFDMNGGLDRLARLFDETVGGHAQREGAAADKGKRRPPAPDDGSIAA